MSEIVFHVAKIAGVLWFLRKADTRPYEVGKPKAISIAVVLPHGRSEHVSTFAMGV